jgi:L-iditol 2-dehydrogenase
VRAAVFLGGGRLEAREWPVPAIAGDELLLRMRGCGLCGSDIAKIVAPETSGPAVFGHELVGDVVDVGPRVTGFAPGDRVVAAHHVPCGACHYCARGSHSMCRAFKRSHLDPGGFAEYVRVPGPNVRHATFRLPSHVSDEAAAFVEPLACCLRAAERAGIQPGDTTVVIGLGSIGALLVQVAKREGAVVVGVDLLEERMAHAKRLGADVAGAAADAGAAVRELSEGRGADQVVVTGGGPAVLGWAASVVRDGGAVHCFAGGGGGSIPIPLATLYERELTLTATYSSSPATLAQAFRLISARALLVEGLITHRLPLDHVGHGVDLVRRHEALKVYVTP